MYINVKHTDFLLERVRNDPIYIGINAIVIMAI